MLKEDGNLIVWGSNEQGQLGIKKSLTEKVIEFSTFKNQEEGEQDNDDEFKSTRYGKRPSVTRSKKQDEDSEKPVPNKIL